MSEGIQSFDFSLDLLRVILWQYDDATRLKSLLEQKAAWYVENHTNFWQSWITDVFDLQTANDFGLSVWAQILNVPLVATSPASGDRPVFGFADYGLNFDNGNFGQDADGTIGLDTEQKRLLLRLRYYQLTSTGAIPEINRVMRAIFGDQGVAYALDGLDMTMTYIFDFTPASAILFVLENFDVLPRPAAVGLTVLIQPSDTFGFAPYYLNFDNSNFRGA